MSSRLVLAAGLAGLLAGCSPPSPQSKPSPAAPPAVVPAEALNALKEQDFDRAATLLAKFLETRPDSRLALALYARATQQQAAKADEPARWDLFRKSAGAARKLRDAYRPLSVDEARLIIQALYNDGCALARLGQPEQALEALSEAVDAGLDAPSLFDADADLDTLRSRPEFARLRHDATLGGAPRRLARNHPFPFGFRLPDARKKLVASDDLKGKVVVVNFWASWSPPCRREAPLLAELDRKYRAKGLEIVGLNDEKDDAVTGPFLAEFPSPYPQLQADEATKKRLPHWDGYPTTILLDRKGQVRLLVEGFGPADGPMIEQAVTILLGEK